jgi:putative transposase
MPFKRSQRLPTFDYIGMYRYSVTICTEARCQAFTVEADVTCALTQLGITANAECFAVIAYCFMTDHLHLLVEGTSEAAAFCEFVRIFKQRFSYQWKAVHGTKLWQRDYFEHVLRAEDHTITVARYIVSNPVRAGLVNSPEAYPFSGSLTMDLRDLVESVQMQE